jgi:transposase
MRKAQLVVDKIPSGKVKARPIKRGRADQSIDARAHVYTSSTALVDPRNVPRRKTIADALLNGEPAVPSRIRLLEDRRIFNTIVKAVRAGNYFSTACRIAGIEPKLGLHWLAQGFEGMDDLTYRFYCSCQKNDAKSERDRLKDITDLSKDDGRLGLEIMARRWPERWGRKETNRGLSEGTINAGTQNPTEGRDDFAQKIRDDKGARRLARKLVSRTITVLPDGSSTDYDED